MIIQVGYQFLNINTIYFFKIVILILIFKNPFSLLMTDMIIGSIINQLFDNLPLCKINNYCPIFL
jgi:hypothetical protein